MKRSLTFKILGTAAFFLIAGYTFAQDNYTIKMNMKMEGLPAEYAAYGEQDIVTYIKGDKSKTEMTSMMGSNILFFDGKKVTSLSDAMGNKMGFTATKEELEAADKKEPTEKPKIEYVAEKKMIAGYECSKAIVTTIGKDKKENKSTVWYTDKIKSNNSAASKARRGSLDLSELKGYPLSMEMNMSQNGMDLKMMLTASEVATTPVDDAVFVVNTEGYTMMSYKEMMEKQKSMGGGK